MNWMKRIFGGKPGEMNDALTAREEARNQNGGRPRAELTSEQTARVARLKEVLTEARPASQDEWVHDLTEGGSPEQSLQVIEAVAVTYLELTSAAEFDVEEKQRLYDILYTLTAMGESPELQASLPQGKGLPELPEIWERYERAWRAGERP